MSLGRGLVERLRVGFERSDVVEDVTNSSGETTGEMDFLRLGLPLWFPVLAQTCVKQISSCR